MKYVFVAKSSGNPATRYRVTPIVDRLRARGDHVTVFNEPNLVSQLHLVLLAIRCNLIFVQRKLLSTAVVWLLSKVSTPIVFDYDDAIFLRSSGLVSRTRQARYRAITRSSHLVLAGNSYLQRAAESEGVPSAVVPTSVELERYGTFEKEECLTMVWIGSRSTARYLEKHREVFSTIARRFPSIRLRVISDFHFDVRGMQVECFGWSESSESQLLGSSHIGIAPMSDGTWTRGKCALKVIQYMAAGLPVVSSNVGANRDVVSHGKTGFLVDTPDAWCEAIDQLAGSDELRGSMGAAGRSRVEQQYNQVVVAARTIALLDEVVSGHFSTN